MQMNDHLNGFLWGTAMGAGAAITVGLSAGRIVSGAGASAMGNERRRPRLSPPCLPSV